jgi:hypothetical protein
MRAARGRIWAAALAVTLVAPIGAEQAAHAVAASSIRAVQIHSSYENSRRSVSRDVGISTQLPDGHQLWLFGDTGVWETDGTWHQTRFIPGSTAMLAKGARGQVPSGGELPSGTPKIFLPTPHTYLPNGSGKSCVPPAAAFSARWPTGVAVLPSNTSLVLVTYTMVCVTKSGNNVGSRGEGWGFALYNWRTRKLTRVVDVFKPTSNGAAMSPSKTYGDPIFVGGNPLFPNGAVTMYSSQCSKLYVQCTAGRVSTVTMPATVQAMSQAKSYHVQQSLTDGSSSWTPLAISVGLYPSGYRLLETTSIGGNYKLFSAPQPTGPWHLVRSDKLPGCPSRKRFCFALEGHTELSTASSLVLSYHDPDSGPGGHIVLSMIPD